MHSNYYEAIIQVRPEREDINQKIEELSRAKSVNISRIKRLKTGIDYYLSSWRAAQGIVKKLLAQFGGTSSVSRKLHTEKDGKKLYRSSIIYRPARYAKGDVIVSDGKVVRVSSSGKEIRGTDLLTGKKCAVSIDDVEVLKIEKVQVSKTKPHLEVLHPETYQSIEVVNEKPVKSETVKVVVYNEQAILLD